MPSGTMRRRIGLLAVSLIAAATVSVGTAFPHLRPATSMVAGVWLQAGCSGEECAAWDGLKIR